MPSETRITLALFSVECSASAAARSESEIGVLPFGLMPSIAALTFAASNLLTGTISSMSLQSPFERWP